MLRREVARLAGVLVAGMLVGVTPAVAQTARSGGDAAVRLQQMLQQANADKAALAVENQQLKATREAAERELASLKGERDGLAGRVSQAEGAARRAEAGKQSVNATLEASQARLQEIVAKYRELAESARQLEAERNRLNTEGASRQRQLDSCQEANVELAGIAEDALKQYEDKGVFDALAQKEAVTGIPRARIANLVDEYRVAIEARKLPRSGGKAP